MKVLFLIGGYFMVSGLWYEENILGHTTDKTYVTQYTIDYLYDNFYNTNDIVKNFVHVS